MGKERLAKGFGWWCPKIVSCPLELQFASRLGPGCETGRVVADASEKHVASEAEETANTAGDVVVVDVRPGRLIQQRV
jgi:hypothetical protein